MLAGSSRSGIIKHKEEIISELRSNGFTYEVHIPAQEIDVESLSFDSAHIARRNHNINEEKAKDFIRNVSISYTKSVRGEQFENYIGDEGAAYVNKETGLIRTAFARNEYNPGTTAIINTVNKYK